MIAIIVGAPALTLLLLIAAAILIGTAEGRPTLHRTRLAAWCAFWLLVAGVLTLIAGARRAGGSGLRKLAGRIRAIRPAPGPQPGAAPERKPAQAPGRHRKPAVAR